MKTIIITDSTSDITIQEAENLDIIVLPLTVTFGDKSFIDGIDLTKKQFYEMQEISEDFPITSQVNPDAFLGIFNKAKKDCDEVIYIGISSKLSGTYQSAQIAKDMSEYENIYLIDSASASLGEYGFIIKACEMRKEEKSAKEIAEFLNSRVGKCTILAAVDTLKYLIKGGRISKTMGAIGGVLDLKPIIAIADGEITSAGKARGRQNAFKMIEKNILAHKIDQEMPIVVTNSNNPELMEEFIEFLISNGISYKWYKSEVGSVIGTHTGPNCVGISFFVE